MIANTQNFHPEVVRWEEYHSWRWVALKINWWGFESPEEIKRYFSYYSRHILAGTIMAGWWYNATEHVNGSVLSEFLYGENYQSFLKYWRWVISRDKQVIRKVENAFYHQNPIWSGKKWWEDLKEKLGWYHHWELIWVIKLLVRFHISEWGNVFPFDQLYLIWIQKRNSEPWAKLVWSRQWLYEAYRDAYKEDYPIDNPYPKIDIPASLELINEWRDRYNLPPLLSLKLSPSQ